MNEFGRWLRETVGALRSENPDVPDAIRNLGVPIVTTNYDSLLDHGTDRKPYTWQQSQCELVLRGETQGIVHLHGHWDAPGSVVLGISSYGEVLDSEPAQALFKAIGTLKTLLFIGCGDGLDDPNFSAFRDWLKTTKKNSEYPHYRLALSSEVETLQKKHQPDERVTVIPFGDEFADLPLFLHDLAQAAVPDRSTLFVSSGTGAALLGTTSGDGAGMDNGGDSEPVGPSPDSDLDRQLNAYFKLLVERHGWIRFLELKQGADSSDAPIAKMYVAPQVARQEIPPDLPLENWPPRQTIRDVLRDHSKLVLLSDPGAGKSTLVSWLAWQFNRSTGQAVSDWAKGMGDWIPVPLILRELPLKADVTWESLLDAFVASPLGQKLPEPNRTTVEQWLRDGRAWVLIDGLDEVSSLAVRRKLRDAIHAGLSEYPNARWLMTSRIVGYEQVPFDRTAVDEDATGLPRNPALAEESVAGDPGRSRTGTPVAELGWLAPFDDDEIKAFAELWYQQRETRTEIIPERVAALVEAIHSNDGTERLGRIAFLLTMMALIHRRDVSLPDGRAQLYEQIAEAYLDSIDARRRRDSGQEVFNVDGTWSLAQKKSWLAGVAWRMQLRRSEMGDPNSEEANRAILVEHSELVGWLAEDMQKLHGDQAESEAERLLKYLTQRSGLLLPRGANEYAFIHLSMQEYFAACWLLPRLKMSVFAPDDVVTERPSDDKLREWADSRVWRETFVLLFELLEPDDAAGLNADLFECLFHECWKLDFDTRSHRPTEQAARLAAELIADRHVSLPAELKCRVRRQLLRWDFESMQRFSTWRWHMTPVVVQVCLLESRGDLMRVWDAAGLTKDERAEWQVLDLRGCTSLSDVGPLQHLTSLTNLDLSGCTSLTDVGPLQQLTNLKTLFLSGCASLSDVGPMQQLSNLTTLDLGGCTSLNDAGPLQHLTSLTSLGLSGCASLSDVGPLQHLTSLTSLGLSGCASLSDVGPLQHLTSLTSLGLSRCASLSDVGPLQYLTRLTSLRLIDCTLLSDLTPLQYHSNLTFLALMDCVSLTDVGPLQQLTNLKTLFLCGCASLSDLTPLQHFTSLTHLDLSGCTSLTDVGPLQHLTNLNTLFLRDCTSLSDISPLQHLASLTHLDLPGCGGRETLPDEMRTRNGLRISE